jgi:signal transduction histidine kinase
LIHDINNIVANIPDLVQELKDALAAAEDRNQIDRILYDLKNNAEATHRVSARLRDFVFVGTFNPTCCTLEPVIKKAKDILHKVWPQHVVLRDDFQGGWPQVTIDSGWIELMLVNLLSNAYESIPPDQRGMVTIYTWADDDCAYIAIQDNGRGIIEEHLPDKIFEPWFTTKPDESKTHGIGLFHCQQIARVHHGKIEVQSMLGVGSLFTVSLPRTPNKETMSYVGV